jgi:RNA polymerase sigma-70 factor (ECF subfamily)
MQPRVQRWVLAYVSGEDEADDVVQEVFVIALRRLRQYRGEGAFQSWLYRVAVRAAARVRKKVRHRAVLAGDPKAIPDRLIYETDPGGRVDREKLTGLIREFWRELPERQRTVVDLVDLQGHSPAEAASMLELNPATLRANLFKGRQTLRSRLIARFPSLATSDTRDQE